MPELPEVQTTVNGINLYLKGLVIKDVWTNYGGAYHTGKDNIKDSKFFANFKKQIIGKKIIEAKRQAKNILIFLSGDLVVLVHMKMTGHLLYGKYEFDSKSKKDPWRAISPEALKDPFNRFIRLLFTFSNGKSLALSDMRRFAKVTLFKKSDLEKTSHLENIGPDALDKNLTYQKFKERLLKKSRGKIKQVLMDQSIIAGIGNIYSDEALCRAGIHPESAPAKIPDKILQKLFLEAQNVLKKGIDFGGDSMSDYRNIEGTRGEFQNKHIAYRRTGKKCLIKGCKGKIVRKVIATRSAHFCDIHQKLYI